MNDGLIDLRNAINKKNLKKNAKKQAIFLKKVSTLINNKKVEELTY